MQLTATNWLGRSSTKAAAITINEARQPRIAIDGGLSRTVRPSDSLLLRVAATIPSCGAAVIAADIQYIWQQTDGPSTINLGWFQSTREPQRLQLPPGTLTPTDIGLNPYQFRATVSATVDGTRISASATVTITVKSSSLVVVITGGDQTYSVASPTALLLDGSRSFDPDLGVMAATSAKSPVVTRSFSSRVELQNGSVRLTSVNISATQTYRWSCSIVGSAGSCPSSGGSGTFFDDAAAPTLSGAGVGPVQTIETSRLSALVPRTLRFSLLVRQDASVNVRSTTLSTVGAVQAQTEFSRRFQKSGSTAVAVELISSGPSIRLDYVGVPVGDGGATDSYATRGSLAVKNITTVDGAIVPGISVPHGRRVQLRSLLLNGYGVRTEQTANSGGLYASLQWKLTRLTSNGVVASSQVLAFVAVSRLDRESLAIETGLLVAGAAYRFEVVATDFNGRVASAAATIVPNSGPTGGQVTIDPPIGTEFSTRFRIVGSGWTDDDFPLQYRFWSVVWPGESYLRVRFGNIGSWLDNAVQSASAQVQPLTPRQPAADVETVLARTASSEGNQTVFIVLEVTDSLGSSTFAVSTLQLVPIIASGTDSSVAAAAAEAIVARQISTNTSLSAASTTKSYDEVVRQTRALGQLLNTAALIQGNRTQSRRRLTTVECQCSGHGQCNKASSIVTTTVQPSGTNIETILSSGSNQTGCLCQAGWSGAQCELSATVLGDRQDVRAKLTTLLLDATASMDISAGSAGLVASALASVSAEPVELQNGESLRILEALLDVLKKLSASQQSQAQGSAATTQLDPALDTVGATAAMQALLNAVNIWQSSSSVVSETDSTVIAETVLKIGRSLASVATTGTAPGEAAIELLAQEGLSTSLMASFARELPTAVTGAQLGNISAVIPAKTAALMSSEPFVTVQAMRVGTTAHLKSAGASNPAQFKTPLLTLSLIGSTGSELQLGQFADPVVLELPISSEDGPDRQLPVVDPSGRAYLSDGQQQDPSIQYGWPQRVPVVVQCPNATSSASRSLTGVTVDIFDNCTKAMASVGMVAQSNLNYTIRCEPHHFGNSFEVQCPYKFTAAACQFWDYATASWNSSGCSVSGIGASMRCNCIHLTDFAGRFTTVQYSTGATLREANLSFSSFTRNPGITIAVLTMVCLLAVGSVRVRLLDVKQRRRFDAFLQAKARTLMLNQQHPTASSPRRPLPMTESPRSGELAPLTDIGSIYASQQDPAEVAAAVAALPQELLDNDQSYSITFAAATRSSRRVPDGTSTFRSFRSHVGLINRVRSAALSATTRGTVKALNSSKQRWVGAARSIRGLSEQTKASHPQDSNTPAAAPVQPVRNPKTHWAQALYAEARARGSRNSGSDGLETERSTDTPASSVRYDRAMSKIVGPAQDFLELESIGSSATSSADRLDAVRASESSPEQDQDGQEMAEPLSPAASAEPRAAEATTVESSSMPHLTVRQPAPIRIMSSNLSPSIDSNSTDDGANFELSNPMHAQVERQTAPQSPGSADKAQEKKRMLRKQKLRSLRFKLARAMYKDRLKTVHSYLNLHFTFDPALSRSKRMFILVVTLLAAMFANCVLYDVRDDDSELYQPLTFAEMILFAVSVVLYR